MYSTINISCASYTFSSARVKDSSIHYHISMQYNKLAYIVAPTHMSTVQSIPHHQQQKQRTIDRHLNSSAAVRKQPTSVVLFTLCLHAHLQFSWTTCFNSSFNTSPVRCQQRATVYLCGKHTNMQQSEPTRYELCRRLLHRDLRSCKAIHGP